MKIYPLRNPENWEQLIKVIKDRGIFNKEEVENEVNSEFYIQGDLPDFSYVEKIYIGKNKLSIQDGNRLYKTKGGKFFPYKIAPEVYGIFEIPLIEMQIVSDLIDENTGKLHKMFDDNCLLYSLKQNKLNVVFPKKLLTL